MTTELKPKYANTMKVRTERFYEDGRLMECHLDFKNATDSKEYYLHTPEDWQKEAEELLREGWEARARREQIDISESDDKPAFIELMRPFYDDFDSFLKSRKV